MSRRRPFAPASAEEIRDANRPGTIYRYKVETSGSYAGPPVLFYNERGGTRLVTSTLVERKAGR